MSYELDRMMSFMLINRVPAEWTRYAYPSLKPLAPWVSFFFFFFFVVILLLLHCFVLITSQLYHSFFFFVLSFLFFFVVVSFDVDGRSPRSFEVHVTMDRGRSAQFFLDAWSFLSSGLFFSCLTLSLFVSLVCKDM